MRGHQYTFRGKTQSLPAWSQDLQIPESTLRSRLGKLGMSVEEAFGTPVDDRFHPAPNPPSFVIPPPPKLARHVSGAARVRWTDINGRRREKYLSTHGTPESMVAYITFCREWYAQRGRVAPPAGEAVSVREVVDRYVEYAEATFRKHGRITSEVYGVRAALGRVTEAYGGEGAAVFGPLKFRTVIDGMVREDLSRKTINDYRDKIVRCWKWAVGRELVPAATIAALEAVERLIAGRTEARESEPIRSVADEHLEAVLPHLHPDELKNAVLAAMTRIARTTGMRPGEVCVLRGDQLDRTRSEWLYQPPSKMLHLDKHRRVWIGPRGQAVLGPLLEATGAGDVFVIHRRRGEGVVKVNEQFWRMRLADACRIAEVPVFTPNQLRHSRATEVKDRYEDDAAVAAALGNSPEVARQVYIDNPADKVARRIAKELG